ncbi:MAG: co-chaperone GroES [Alphaproteobacteria bacterium]
MNFRPLGSRVVIERVEEDDKTAGGIIIPDSAKEKPAQGKVLAVGAGERDDSGAVQPLEVKVGDIVLFVKWGGTEVKIDSKELLIVKESELLGIIQ